MRNKWTKEKCQEIALQYKTKIDFIKNENSCYLTATNNGWLDEICLHMTPTLKYWSLDKCREEALKYTTRKDFKDGSGSAYGYAIRLNIIDEITTHMINFRKPKFYWTKEKCQEEVLKYKTKKEFKENSTEAYNAARKNKWLNDISGHLLQLRKNNNYWTKERCHEEALKYNHRTEFNKNSVTAYIKAHKEKWLDEICSHMKILGNRSSKCIYSYEFSDNCVYVGLTYNIKDRQYRHENDKTSQVYKHIQKTSIKPIFKTLTGFIDVNEAIIKEEEYLQKYKSEGWVTLNVHKTGGIGGGVIKWTYEKCKIEAIKYNSRWEFCQKNSSAYYSVLKNKWGDELFSHMKPKHH